MDRDHCISELSKCIRCGTCKAYCPTYEEGLSEPLSARGRLTLLRGFLTGQVGPSPLLIDRIFSCVLCGACEKLCPPHVEVTEAIYHGRRVLRDFDRRRRLLRGLAGFALKRPAFSHRIARLLQPLALPYLLKKGLPAHIPVSAHPLRDNLQVYKPQKKIGRVAVFTGCSTNFLFPQLGLSLINVLIHLGYEVVLPKGEVCCGAPLRGLGLEEEAAAMALKNYQAFSKLKTDAVVSLCPTCILSLQVSYPSLIGKGLKDVVDISTFLSGKIEGVPLHPPNSFTSVTYHDPCHLNYSLGVREEPRQVIRSTGAELIEAEGDGCCGFGGLFSLQYRDISQDLLRKRVDAYVRTGADAIVTSCTGCMIQLSSGLKDKQVFHIIELIEEAIC